MHRRLRTIGGAIVVCGLLFGTVGMTAGAAAAKTPKHKTFKSTGTFTTNSIGADGSFSAPIAMMGKGGVSDADTTLSGTTTQGPGSVTKTNAKVTATVGADGTFTVNVNGAWLQSTLTGTITPPHGFGEPAAARFSIKCVCDWAHNAWSWTIKLSFVSDATA